MRTLRHPLIVIALFAGSPSCTEAEAPGTASSSEPVALKFDLPSGVAVVVDGEPRGRTPLEPLMLAGGSHQVMLSTACVSTELSVTLESGRGETIDRPRAGALGFATVQITTNALDGKALPHTVTVDGEQRNDGASSSTFELSACEHRLGVTSPGVASWSEVVTPKAGEALERSITLTEGPDVIRIPGKRFRIGPPGPSRYIPGLQSTEDLTREEQQGWPWLAVMEVDVPTLDFDKSEVTAGQFHACRKSGKCPWKSMKLRYTKMPPREDRTLCTTVERSQREPRPGWANRPMNCISRWEAEMYCEAHGKRLPMDAEWEHAARGGREDFHCPWGPLSVMTEDSRGYCAKPGKQHAMPSVCDDENPEWSFGLCGIIDGVGDMVGKTPGRTIWPNDLENLGPVRGGSFRSKGTTTFGDGALDVNSESADVGFRCVREVEGPR
ncbi:MAG: SUMF1/EgtB/PvdO family nonheme iron enzyme [Myxococcota bacterium]